MEISELQVFDYLIIVIIALSAYLSWKKGFIESFIDLFAWVGSAFIVADNYSKVFNFFSKIIPSNFICIFIASFCFYILLVILFYLLGDKIVKWTSKFGSTIADKIAGGFFGVFRGVLISMVVLWCTYTLLYAVNDKKMPDWLAKSQTYKPLKMAADSTVDLITSEKERKKLFEIIKKKSNKLEDELKANAKKTSRSVSEYSNDDPSFEED